MQTTSASLRLSGREVQALNLLAARAKSLAIKLDPALEMGLELLSRDEGGPAEGLGASESFAIEWGGARFELAFPRAALTDWFNARLGALGYDGAEITTLNTHWRETARTHALGWMLDGLARCGRGQARVADPADQVDAARAPVPFVFGLTARIAGAADAGATVLHGRMGCDSLGLMLIAGLVSARTPAPGGLEGADSALPLRLAVQLGSTTLPLAQLRALRLGDIVLVKRMLREPDGVFHLRLDLDHSGGSAAFRARLEEGALISLDELVPIMPDTPPMPPAPPAPPTPQDTPLALEQLPVRLDFDLGELTLTLAQLRTLHPGQALPLSAPISGAVTIRANGAVIGSGELVEIDGRSGVLIRTLFPPQVSAATTVAPPADDDDET